MADTRLPSPPRPTLPLADWAHGFVHGVEFFMHRLRPTQPRESAPPTRAQLVAQIVAAQGCRCHGACPHCRHIIKDVLGN